MADHTIFNRALLYEDQSGTEAGVSFDPTYTLGHEGERYIRIEGVGDATYIPLQHLSWLIARLQELDGVVDDHDARMRVAAEQKAARMARKD